MLIDFLSDFYGKHRPRTKRNPLGYKKPRAKPIADSLIWVINELPIPVELFRDPKRTSWRFAFAKGGKLNVRIPLLQSEGEADLLREIQKRLSDRMTQKPDTYYEFFTPKLYYGGDTLFLSGQEYTLDVFIEARKTNTGKLVIVQKKKMIYFRLDAYMEERARQTAIGTLLSRIISADCLPEFSKRVRELNAQFFGKYNKKIKDIKFKYNHSNWGSCSTTGNLNFSSRLLFAPIDVQNYVIIHELAHLVEMNHSGDFWVLVAKAMPDYEEKEQWLKENGTACRF